MIFFIVGLLLIWIFHSWFIQGALSAGDWPYLYLENIKEFAWLPESRFLWLAPWNQILTKIAVEQLRIPWEATEKLFWFLPFILLSIFSSYKLTKSIIGSLIYTTNTYILMIIGGGQLGIALSYSLAPLVLYRFINFNKHFSSIKNIKYQISNIKYDLISGLLLSIQVMFDPRIALLTLIAAFLYHLFIKLRIQDLPQVIVLPTMIAGILNFYWIIPLLKSQLPVSQQIGEATSVTAKFLSFATFEQTLSLLHPNWPENIFGKVYFMRPEFLVLPLLVYGGFLFYKNYKDYNLYKKYFYFAFLLLLGAFLAKGTNPPFGEVYLWMFEHVPGFKLFRDPTKFYFYIALSYSVLIPFSLNYLKRVVKLITHHLLLITFVIFWFFTIREASSGKLTGTFQPMPVPQEYIQFKNFVDSQPDKFQTLWIPERQRFGFASKLHPALDARLLSGESSIGGILAWISREEMRQEVLAQNIKYVIVPDDSRGELFLTDRKYNETLYRETLADLMELTWLIRLDNFNRIGVFTIKEP